MDFIETFINGMVSGLGMVIIMTIFSALTFFFLKPWITKVVTEIWTTVREAGLIEIKLDGKEKEDGMDVFEQEYTRQMKKIGVEKSHADKSQRKDRK